LGAWHVDCLKGLGQRFSFEETFMKWLFVGIVFAFLGAFARRHATSLRATYEDIAARAAGVVETTHVIPPGFSDGLGQERQRIDHYAPANGI
jgi:hypothetical protein